MAVTLGTGIGGVIFWVDKWLILGIRHSLRRYKHLPFPTCTLKWPKAFPKQVSRLQKLPRTSLYFPWRSNCKGGRLGSLLRGVTFPPRHMRTALIILVGELHVHRGEKWVPCVRAVRNFFFHYIALLSFYLQELCSFCTLLSAACQMSHFLIPYSQSCCYAVKASGRFRSLGCCSEKPVLQHGISALIAEREVSDISKCDFISLIWSLCCNRTPFQGLMCTKSSSPLCLKMWHTKI